MILKRTLILSLITVCLATPCLAEQNLRAKKLQEAKALVERYFRFEEVRDYEHAYELLSVTFKRDLMRENDAKNGPEYKKIRVTQGLRWMKTKIKDISFDSQLNADVVVTAEYEQHVYGEHVVYGKVDLGTMVVWENEKPLVDSVALIKVH